MRQAASQPFLSVGVPRAPISDAQRRMLHRRLSDLHATAKRKGYTLSSWEHANEKIAGELYFEVGAWGYWSSLRRYRLSVQDRARVSFAILAAGLTHIGYEFHTCFDFGERDFDAFYEMGDADQVIDALADLVRLSGHAVAAQGMRQLGWSIEDRQQSLFTESAAS